MADFIEVEGLGMGRAGRAFVFQGDGWEQKEFLPLSQIEIIPQTDSEENGRCTVKIPMWLARKNGWD